MVDMEEGEDIVDVFVHDPERKLLVVSTDGNGFVVPEDELVANTRKGKQVLNVSTGEEMRLCVAAAGDMVAIIGENRKMLIFPLDQVPEMARGKGVRLQKYKDGGRRRPRLCQGRRADLDRFLRPNLQPPIAELKDWVGDRAQAGRLAPQGFPRSNSLRGSGSRQ